MEQTSFPCDFVEYDENSIQFKEYSLTFKMIGEYFEDEDGEIYDESEGSDIEDLTFGGWQEEIVICYNGLRVPVRYEQSYDDSCKYRFIEVYELVCKKLGLPIYEYENEV